MKIAIVRLSALGDIIQSSIVLQFIKKFQPKAQIHFFVDSRFKELLEHHPLINKLYALPLKDKKFLSVAKELFKLRKEKYDLIIDMQGLIKSAIVSRMLGVNVFGFDKYGLKESFAANFYNQKFHIHYNENIIIRNLSLIAFVFNESFKKEDILCKEPVFQALNEIKNKLNLEYTFQKSKLNVLIHSGASVQNKIYPKQRLALLIKLMADFYKDIRFFLSWGSEKERQNAKDIIHLSGVDANTCILLRKLNLQELVAMTSCVDLIIGNDSGPTHLAFAMNKPSITIFGATPSQRNAYETPINKVINAGKKISDAKHIDKSDFCIQNVDEDAIFELAKELISNLVESGT